MGKIFGTKFKIFLGATSPKCLRATKFHSYHLISVDFRIFCYKTGLTLEDLSLKYVTRRHKARGGGRGVTIFQSFDTIHPIDLIHAFFIRIIL